MEAVIFFLMSSLLWAVGYPVMAYPYAKKLKTEYSCPSGIFVFAVFTGQAEISVHLLNPGEWSVKN